MPASSSCVTLGEESSAEEEVAIGMPNKRARSIIRKIGIAEILLGIIAFALSIAIIALKVVHIGYPVKFEYLSLDFAMNFETYCGFVLLVIGILGFRVKEKSTSCFIKANLVTGIISSIVMTVFFVFYLMYAIIWTQHPNVAVVTLGILYTLVNFAAAVACICHSVLCSCCSPWLVKPIDVAQPNQLEERDMNGHVQWSSENGEQRV